MAWDKAIGSFKVLPAAKVVEGTAPAGDALQTKHIKVAARASLLQWIQSNKGSYIAFVCRFMPFSAIIYFSIEIIFAFVEFYGIHTAPWVQKVFSWIQFVPVFSLFETRLLVLCVLMCKVLV